MDLILIFTLSALLFWGVFLFNRLIADRHRVAAAWSDIQVQLKRRRDLIPKLVDTVRGYADYEQALLTAVTELRARSETALDAAESGPLEGELGQGVRRLLALAEAYPELKANTVFLELQQELSRTEDQIQLSRRFYNGAVRIWNTRRETFPDLLLVRLFGWRPRDYFDTREDA